MEYPVSGKISIGAYHASDEDDLVALYSYLLQNHGLEAALELGDKYPEVFVKTYDLRVTQDQVDMIHLLLGYVSSSKAFELDRILEAVVSPDALEKYDRVSWIVDSEDGLNIKID